MTGLILTLVAVLLVAAIVYAVMKKKSPSVPQSDHTGAEAPADDSTLAQESLLSVNLELRKNSPPGTVLDRYENLIDELLDVVPEINSQYPDGELAWVINRIATEYLPQKSVNPYLGLDAEQRASESTIAEVLEGVDGMLGEVTEVKSLLQSRKTSEFSSKARFLKQRFNI